MSHLTLPSSGKGVICKWQASEIDSAPTQAVSILRMWIREEMGLNRSGRKYATKKRREHAPVYVWITEIGQNVDN
jgi:hypothetical protein